MRLRGDSAPLRLLLSLALCGVLVSVVSSSPVTAAAVVEGYQSALTAPDVPAAVDEPAGMAVDSSGTVFVADPGSDRVRVIASDGSTARSIGRSGSGDGGLRRPECVVLGSDGNVYVADTGNNRISVFSRYGSFLRAIASGSVSGPRGVWVSSGVVYVSDTGGGRVRSFSASTGAHLGDYGSGTGTQDAQAIGPEGVVATGGRLYVCDRGNDRVKVFDLATRGLLANWGITRDGETSTSRFKSPTGMSLAPDGTLLIADTGNNRIERCSIAGDMVQQWGGGPYSSAEGFFHSPRGVVQALGGTMFVADTGNVRISRLSGTWLPSWYGYGSGPDRLRAPEAVAVSPAGVITVADTQNSRLSSFSATSGAGVGIIGSPGGAPGQFATPSGLEYGPDGFLYVSDSGNDRVQKLNPDGSVAAIVGAGVLDDPHGIAFSAFSPEMFVADTGHNCIRVFSTETGALSRSIGTSGTGLGQLSAPRGVAIDSGDMLWVADTGNSRIQKFRAWDGVGLLARGSMGPAEGQFIQPTDVLSMPGDDVLVSDAGNDRLQRWSAAGNLIDVIARAGELPGPLHRPVAAALSPSGGIVVVERDAHRAQFLVQDGTAPTTAILGIPAHATSTTVTFSLEASDSASGVGATYYRLNGVSESVYRTPVTISSEGQTIIQYWSIDRVGNTGPAQTANVTIDRTPPSGAVAIVGAPWIRSRTTTLVSNVSGADEMRITVGTSSDGWRPYATAVPLIMPPTDGRYELVAEYRDEAGNTLQKVAPANVDTAITAPVAWSPTHPLDMLVRSGTTATFAWRRQGDVSGIAGYSWSLDRSATGAADSSVDTTATRVTVTGLLGGTHYFHLRAVDGAGNWSATTTVPIRLTSQVRLARPSAMVLRKTLRGRLVSVVGRVSPAAAVGRVVVLTAYRYESGRWVRRATTRGAVRALSGGDAGYSARMSLGSGWWRVQASSAYDEVFEGSVSAPTTFFVP